MAQILHTQNHRLNAPSKALYTAFEPSYYTNPKNNCPLQKDRKTPLCKGFLCVCGAWATPPATQFIRKYQITNNLYV